MDKKYTVFEKWYQMLKWINERTESFPKKVKLTFSDRVLNISYDILDKIVESLYSKDKIDNLKKVNLNLEKLRIYFRMSFERKYISMKQYEYISSEINEFGKIIGGWIKSIKD